jgi:hypothetical protein
MGQYICREGKVFYLMLYEITDVMELEVRVREESEAGKWGEGWGRAFAERRY